MLERTFIKIQKLKDVLVFFSGRKMPPVFWKNIYLWSQSYFFPSSRRKMYRLPQILWAHECNDRIQDVALGGPYASSSSHIMSRTQCWEDPLHPLASVSWPGHSAGRTICIPQLPYHDQDVEPGGPSASHNSHIFLPPLHNIPFEVSRRWYSFSSRAEQPTVTYSQFFDQLGDSTFIIHHTDFCDKDREQH